MPAGAFGRGLPHMKPLKLACRPLSPAELVNLFFMTSCTARQPMPSHRAEYLP